jgi:hypothetical protein
MSTNPNENYFKPSLGSLTGFDRVDLPGAPDDVVETGWSIDQLRVFLLNEGGANFASEQWVRLVNEALQEHIQDFDNPHKVTLQQITPDVIAGILENLTTGTVPSTAPFLAYDVCCPLPIGTVYPAAWSTLNMYRVTEGGMFVDPSTETEVLGVDSLNGQPGLPMFGSILNIVPQNWATQSGTALGTKLAKRTSEILPYPFDFYVVSETSGVRSFGVVIQATQAANTTYTTTFFIRVSAAGGSVVLSQQGDSVNTMTVNLTSGESVCSTNAVAGKTVLYPSGVIKVSFSFTTASPAVGKVAIVHVNDNTDSPNRSGITDRVIFNIGYPLMTTSSIDHPIAISPMQQCSTSSFQFDLAKVMFPASLSELMVTFAVDIAATLPGTPIPNTTVLALGPLVITRDQTHLYVKMSGVTVFTSDLLDGLNIFTLSYSPTTLIFKDLASPRKTATSTYPTLALTDVTLGAFGGYLRYLAFYAAADDVKCVEFLTNG